MKRAKTATTARTRRESNELVNRKRSCQNVAAVLAGSEKPLTAREIAAELYSYGLVDYPIRQAVQPRLTELVEDGDVIVTGKVYDTETKRNVAAYMLRKG
ncbi:hypothetical protein [Jingyaoa shaoxingensis]|uniref:DNA-binding protein n=1 Tax=Jingyaoa shaoxingensis TaxID=2763671 RepID=A0ABR7NE61_9FIRM|nr:hypothetical protein [Jingyaoa shaoxingensis]MBC8574465.1 hypothetical protein [Jingyaoa shaoxingensis]